MQNEILWHETLQVAQESAEAESRLLLTYLWAPG